MPTPSFYIDRLRQMPDGQIFDTITNGLGLMPSYQEGRARDLNNLASLLQATNRLAEAEPLMRHALAIDENSFGLDHPNVAIDLNNL